ncbi:MAG: FkbM family methyltransferase [Prosthecobacter sp.]
MSRREKLLQWMRPWLERCGIDTLSWPALHSLDRKLASLLPYRDGWFVEAGAHDGFQQSNTYHLARFQGWRGVLVEPVPHLAEECRRNRPESQVYTCVLGPPELTNSQVSLRYAGLMTGVCGSLGDDAMEMARAEQGLKIQGLSGSASTTFDAPVRTLTELLNESHTPARFDLLSLDVEGYEFAVLKGWDLEHHRAAFVCIEARRQNLEQVIQLLSPAYELIEVLHESSEHGDYLFRLR